MDHGHAPEPAQWSALVPNDLEWWTLALILAGGTSLLVWPIVEGVKRLWRAHRLATAAMVSTLPASDDPATPSTGVFSMPGDPPWWSLAMRLLSVGLGIVIGAVGGLIVWHPAIGAAIGAVAGPNAHWIHKLARRKVEERAGQD